MGFKTPVVFMVFNRPDLTEMVLDRLRILKPEILYVGADGPRKGNSLDVEKCAAVRRVIDTVDWECRVIKDYSEFNVGVVDKPPSTITNAFKLFDKAIILEDDCLPHMDFFPFCEEMLERYEHDSRIITIGGGNYPRGDHLIDSSYYFSAFIDIWGWATWRRAWSHYDKKLKGWPRYKKEDRIKEVTFSPHEAWYYTNTFH